MELLRKWADAAVLVKLFPDETYKSPIDLPDYNKPMSEEEAKA